MKGVLLFSLLLANLTVRSQVTGRVINTSNQGVPFASITVKGTGTGTSTDSAGYFSLTVNKKLPVLLIISSVGYEQQDHVVREGKTTDILIRLQSYFQRDTVVITSRRRKEVLQDVPIPVTVIGGGAIDESGAFNVTRIKELIPSVQMYTSIHATPV
jgi:iron complex outermembrane receptor protein